MGDDDDALLYVGTPEDIEAELAAEVSMWEVGQSALAELADATWRSKGAPRFEEGSVLACVGHPNPDLWHSDDPRERLEALSICMACPSRTSCGFQTTTEQEGVWGGDARDGKDGLCSEGHSDWSRNGDKWRCAECRRQKRRRGGVSDGNHA